MKFSIMFFSSDAEQDDPYQMMIELTKLADKNGFSGVWTPERHFDQFGGIYANPSITAAALSTVTSNIQLRSGSLISPLHDSVRILESWFMVDQLSNGRVGISFGSGWNANDFAFYPDRYQTRHQIMYEQIELLKVVSKTREVKRKTPFGNETLKIYPAPKQKEIPIWVTTSGNRDTYFSASKIGANILTHMIMQDLVMIEENIKLYKKSLLNHGYITDPIISLMLHTFVGDDTEKVKEIVRPSFREYLRTAVELELKAGKAGGSISGGLTIVDDEIDDDLFEELLDITFEKYFKNASCMGSVDKAYENIVKVKNAGVNEIACLIDFGVDRQLVVENFKYLIELKNRFENE